MSYTEINFVAFQVLTAANMNVLGDNDASFNDGSGIGNGNATKSNIYCFRAYNSVATTLTDNVETQITLGGESYDYNNNFASNVYTVPVAGVYHISAQIITSALTSLVTANLRIKKNSTVIAFGGGSDADSGLVMQVSGDFLLAQGDTIGLYGYQNSAANETTTAGEDNTWMAGHLVKKS